ncbi:hypothetical protein [Mucilaginibacter rubeus]|uniref:hypothetical protein n=1 Tax=Mucilaginibacter rubeus TaxID=2027860 RepID=UPI00166372CF|nr:hypothetical protein [Mucilaginibacter rubeus]GGA88782.1 hypothetical protein GCM10011500_00500 [Mucilaginibacter rubeus]
MTEEEQLQPPNQPPGNKPQGGIKIVGINLAVFVGYTLLSLLTDGDVVAGLLMVAQVIVCIILSLYFRKWSWFLGGLLVLVIGFSTCVAIIRI